MTQEALAQTQEPFAYYHPHKGFYFAKPTSVSAPTIVDVEPLALYTTPPQRTEQDGQCKRCTDGCPACDATKLQKEAHDLL